MTQNPDVPLMADLRVIRQDTEARRQELVADVAAASYLRGDFVLSSGPRTDVYLDKYRFETRPTILRRLASLLAEFVPAVTDCIAGRELGAALLATAVALETGLPLLVIRAGECGPRARIAGEMFTGAKVLLVEDVVSSGTRAVSAARTVESVPGEVLGIVTVIDREQGGRQAIESAGFHFSALIKYRELWER